MSRKMWKAVEAKVGKARVAETEERRKKGNGKKERKNKRRKRKNQRKNI